MLNKEQSLLLHRENYEVPKGQEQVVHYKVAKLNDNGEIVESPRVCKTGIKMFDGGHKRNLELQGYTVEILYHPLGKYSNDVIVDKNILLAEKDAEIARLKAELAKANESKAEPEAEKPVNKGGRPKKEA